MGTFQIDNGWPHQVALPAAVSLGKANDVVRDFCKDLSLCPRGHTFRRDDQWIGNVWCFAEEVDAQLLDRIVGNGVRVVIVEDASRFARHLLTQEAGIACCVELGVRVLHRRTATT